MAINTIANATRTAMCSAFVTAIDAGSAGGKIKFYTSEGGTLLATCTFSATAFGSPTNGVATADTITSGTAVADGTATVVHFTDSDDNILFKGTVGESAADIIFPETTWGTDDVIAISGMTITQPAS